MSDSSVAFEGVRRVKDRSRGGVSPGLHVFFATAKKCEARKIGDTPASAEGHPLHGRGFHPL